MIVEARDIASLLANIRFTHSTSRYRGGGACTSALEVDDQRDGSEWGRRQRRGKWKNWKTCWHNDVWNGHRAKPVKKINHRRCQTTERTAWKSWPGALTSVLSWADEVHEAGFLCESHFLDVSFKDTTSYRGSWLLQSCYFLALLKGRYQYFVASTLIWTLNIKILFTASALNITRTRLRLGSIIWHVQLLDFHHSKAYHHVLRQVWPFKFIQWYNESEIRTQAGPVCPRRIFHVLGKFAHLDIEVSFDHWHDLAMAIAQERRMPYFYDNHQADAD